MTPEVPSVLSELAGLLLRNADPDTPAGERANALTLCAMILAVAAEVWDDAADILVKENRSFWSLIQTGARLVADPALAADLAAFPAFAEDDYRLSALGAYNSRARGLIIRLHAALEDDVRDEADTVYRTIWALLVASTERRKLSMAPV
ncbi:hypothetical protein [Phenylobacterium sp.]|jgi:hypothetical protein|uniref:hypothetical protein n=1 Tax=Phenylobacterium sp. TaxID=1871053 RepID=UPI002F3ECBB0